MCAGERLIGFLIMIERDLVLPLPQIKIAQLVVSGGDASVAFGCGIQPERSFQISERLICLSTLE